MNEINLLSSSSEVTIAALTGFSSTCFVTETDSTLTGFSAGFAIPEWIGLDPVSEWSGEVKDPPSLGVITPESRLFFSGEVLKNIFKFTVRHLELLKNEILFYM